MSGRRTERSGRPRGVAAGCAVGAVLLACGLAGCYERTVGTNRPGTHRGTVSESNLESSRVPGIDDALDVIVGPTDAGGETRTGYPDR